MVTLTVSCIHCGAINLTRNGHTPNGKQKYRCKGYGKSSRHNSGVRAYGTDFQSRVLAAYHERCSLRGVCRIFANAVGHISRQTLITWLKTKAALLPPLGDTLAPALPDDVLELDETWSFIRQRKHRRWVWLAQCRRTRQVMAYVIGGRGQRECRLLWRRIPKRCPKPSTGPQGRAMGKPVMWNASTTSCANGWRVLSGERFRSPKPTRCTRVACGCSCMNIIQQSKLDRYLIIKRQ